MLPKGETLASSAETGGQDSKQQTVPATTTCGTCAATRLVSSMYVCSACKTVFYCNAGCQTTHWPTHKTACVLAAWKERERQRQQKYREQTKEAISTMSPEERRWKSWLASRGEGSFVNNSNLRQFLPDVPLIQVRVCLIY